MAKILGLDLGTNSIGWALRDTFYEDNQITHKGVLTFEKGVADVKGEEFPMVQKRTESRGKRRHYQAEKYRKQALLKTLIENGMCPLSTDELNEWKHYHKGIGRKYPVSEKFLQWLRFDFDGDGLPDFRLFGLDKHENLFAFRALAASRDIKTKQKFDENKMILGRVLYQMVQRRGFRGRDEGESKTIMEGGGESGSKGVCEIRPYLQQHETLGAALYHIQKETGERIRKRYNLRSDYESELKVLSEIHGLSDALYKELWRAIIWQRPLRSQKGLVGSCTFEKNKSRAPLSHPLYEEYRTWVFINNLKIILPPEFDLETYLEKNIYPLFLNASADFKLEKIFKKLAKDGAVSTAKFRSDTKVLSRTFSYSIARLFGDDWKERLGWNEMLHAEPKKGRYSIEDIWHVLVTFDSKEKLVEFGIEKLGLGPEDAEIFSKMRLPQGYATLSISAIRKLLPYLKKGFKYSHAVLLANLHEVLGAKQLDSGLANHFAQIFNELERNDRFERKVADILNALIADHHQSQHRWAMHADYVLDADDGTDISNKAMDVIGAKSWEQKSEQEQLAIINEVALLYQAFLRKPIHAPLAGSFLKYPRLDERILHYLRETYGISADAGKKLWHPSEQENYAAAPQVNGINVLGEPQPLTKRFKNPMALKTLYQMKKLVNRLLLQGLIDEDTRVVVEIARELNDANKRKAILRWQRHREKENREYSDRIREIALECNLSLNPENKDLIAKYRLWVEQNRQCLYTGKIINLCDLFDGNKFDFEHTVPAGMSFDDELRNLTIADATYNRSIKGKRIPTELPNYHEDAAGYTAIAPRIEFLHEKRESLEKLLDDWNKKSADDKLIKDAIIQRRHMLRMDLDYWRKKADSFTITEHKAGWKNSQLRDTQLITKYALPYLKTAFKKVEVQKGEVTAKFRRIFNIQPRFEAKQRTKHSHHAIDAAVLTLIPPPLVRDKMMQQLHDAEDNSLAYHDHVNDWKNFSPEHILSIEDDVLINFQPKHRTLTHTRKAIRKRGKIQYVKEKNAQGEYQYKKDDQGMRIPMIADGDTIRGQLHKESFFGAIKINGEMLLVERYPISAFTKIEDCKNIVDPAVAKIVEEELTRRMTAGMNFDKAKLDPVPFPNGKAVIKKVRCRVLAGAKYLKFQKALSIREHDFKSRLDYKTHIYAQNSINTVCLFYEDIIESKVERSFKLIGLFELAQLQLKNSNSFYADENLKSVSIKNNSGYATVKLKSVLQVGLKVVIYKTSIDELREMNSFEISRRLYRILKFNEPAPPSIYCYIQHHLEASPEQSLEKEDKDFDPGKYQPRLALTAKKFNCAIENVDFSMNVDGTLNWFDNHQ